MREPPEERARKARERAARWKAANPEKVQAYRLTDKARESVKKSVAKKPEYYAEWRKAWEESNREKRNAQRRERYAANPELGRARSLRYLAKEGIRDKVAARAKAAKERPEERDRLRTNQQNRKAKEKVGGGRLSRGLADKLMVLQKGKCANCKACLKKNNFERDHITPLALGGEHADQNIQLLCPPCNRFKNAKDPIEWAQTQGKLL